MSYFVSYCSAGCLPDNDPMEFQSIEAARNYIEQEWEALAGDHPVWNDDAGNGTSAYKYVMVWIAGMKDGSEVDDPTPGSLYYWSIQYRKDSCQACSAGNWEYEHSSIEYPGGKIVWLKSDGTRLSNYHCDNC